MRIQDHGQLDVAHGTITLPLYLGHMAGSNKNVWYVLTDVDDHGVAAELGLNYLAKLTFAANGARTANLDANGNLVFDRARSTFAPFGRLFPVPSAMSFLRYRRSPEPLETTTIAL